MKWQSIRTACGALAVVISLAGSGWRQESLPADGAPEASLRYLGHASFELVASAGGRIVIDPYQNAWFSHWFDAPFPTLDADVVVSTHSHFDHGAIDRVGGNPRALDDTGELEGPDYRIRAIQGLHARPGRYGPENRIVRIETAGTRIVHWGDNGADVSEELREALVPVDILILPVDDSEHVLTFDDVDAVRSVLEPRVVIPVHYYVPGLTSPCSTLESLDRWLSQQTISIARMPAGKVDISPGRLPGSGIWVFDGPDRPDASGLASALSCRFQSAGPWAAVAGLSSIVGTLFVGRRWRRRKTI